MEYSKEKSEAFHSQMKAIARDVRGSLQQVESISSFNFSVKVSGRVHDSEFKITYQVGEYDNVKGKDLFTTLREYMRRHGWDEINDPPMISDLRIIEDDC